jgi:hypothetical protein
MNYQTVFEIGFRSFPWSALMHPVPFIIIGVLLCRFRKGKQIYQAAGIIGAAMATLFFLLLAVSLVPNFVELRHTYTSGNSSVVEGVVDNFKPAPYLGTARESFEGQGINFSYNALDATPCFHNAPFRKGPIRPGLAVRIYYSDGCIQRLDIRR